MLASQYDEAISQYTAALSLGSAGPQGLLMKQSNAWAGKGVREGALNDAKEWARLMLTSGSWKDALTAGVRVSILLSWHPLCVTFAWFVVYTRKIHDLSGCMRAS